jgi:hypothetical protein
MFEKWSEVDDVSGIGSDLTLGQILVRSLTTICHIGVDLGYEIVSKTQDFAETKVHSSSTPPTAVKIQESCLDSGWVISDELFLLDTMIECHHSFSGVLIDFLNTFVVGVILRGSVHRCTPIDGF